MSIVKNKAFTGLSKEQTIIYDSIRKYDISFVFDRLLMENKIVRSDIPELETEFKKFICLIGCKVFPLAMISPAIDEVWHQFILFTKQYKDFCYKTLGHFVNHLPDTPKTPVPFEAGENFRYAYNRFFGKIPEIWYKGMRSDTRQYYLQPVLLGKPPQEWSGWTGPEE